MRIANTQLLFPYQPIQSISEFSAISGGQANQMITNIGQSMWSGIMMLYGYLILKEGSAFKFSADDFFIIIGVAGVVMIGMFELNQFDRGMILFHYIGVILAICLMVAAIIQGAELGGYHLVCPLILNVIAWPCFLYWSWISRPSSTKKFQLELMSCIEDKGKSPRECLEEARKNINKFSVQCVVLEGTAIYCTVLSLACYLIQWDFDSM